jgi:murein L,D-transpeptidase YafK
VRVTPLLLLSGTFVMLMASPLHSGEGQGNDKADRVVVSKSKRLLILLKNDEIIRQYRVALGANPVGHKIESGDSRTPEGEYILDRWNPKSKYHLSLHISYPNQVDKLRAKKVQVSPGGEIMIHGLPNGMGRIGSMHAVIDCTKAA